MTQNRLVLFDIDETMISSDGAGRRALSRALAKTHGLPPEASSIPMSGKTDPQIITEILTAAGFSQEEAVASREEVILNYLEALDEEIEKSTYYIIHPGVVELLTALQAETRAFLGLLTGNVAPGAEKKLKRFQLFQYFPIGAYGSDSACRLDLPAIAVERAREHFQEQFSPRQVVIIGDSVNDIACARGYGAKAIAVNTGRTSWESLEKEKPCHLFKDLAVTDSVLEAIFS
ncbi:MAG TPA: HAD family hydrolase [Candidatus Obscuribacter sp.]|nr:HAD hydrolase-like protein [Candidatus Obscuribacter sp.]HMW91997.1 HAD family hydrolase [Candidatus Obscuribacter sp.]HMY51591.1 HAD family hydrolase [Candidatus Obscuribacter sp.]HNG21724.1 HAD family hydrolase [Candidatus Obscuribacter sp.]HNH75347.1 HAD family hydrolase [Candidatus Obscuribacter sp.]